jgi:DNA mismatch repair protein MutS2
MPLHTVPAHIHEILEFQKILERLSALCLGPKAAGLCLLITPEKHIDWIRRELLCAHEAQQILENGMSFLTHTYEDIDEDLKLLAVSGYVLEEESILKIRSVLNLITQARAFFAEEERSEVYPALSDIATCVHNHTPAINVIGKVLDDEGNVRPDASKALKKIAQDIQHVSQQCDQVFQQMIRQYSSKEWLADNFESVRNERRVLAVKAEYKRQIRGILHDQSGSGRTVLIEPEEVIPLNNDLFDLRAGYKAEIRRLLRDLCDQLRSHLDEIIEDETLLVELDLHQARGNLARQMDAHMPVLESTPRLSMRRAFHPLLLLKNKRQNRETIPFDLDMHPPNRILLLSGPNAGGKSILMKAVGLLQMMVQSGIPVPVSPDSVFGIFGQISASLGDHQSLEDDLSTYSSKLAEMKECLEHAGADSLVLIDEFGSGTDPRLGGAIAEGILEALCVKEVYGVITTHYSELKAFAYRRHGIVNGAMVFDKDKMTPTYELSVGKPGSSYTFEIAGKSGLPEEVLEYARTRTSDLNLQAMEDLLADLERQKTQLETTAKKTEHRSQQLDQLVKSYERMQTDLTAQRHRMRLEQKEQDYAHLSELNRELEQAVRQIKEEKDVAAAKEKMQEVRALRSKTQSDIGQINDTIKAKHRVSQKPFEVGDAVRMYNGTETGRIENLGKKSVILRMGILRMEVPIGDLVHAAEPLDIRSERSVQSDMVVQEKFDPKLDLRGMRPMEASALLQRFMDLALVSNAGTVQIVHGKGTGALRKMVHDKLKEYPVTIVGQPEDAQGGSGQTVASF